MGYQWHFNAMQPSHKVRESTVGEFFSADAINNLEEALIREGIQNSLDSRIDDQLVVVRIKIKTIQSNLVNNYLNKLNKHLDSLSDELYNPPGENEPCRYLVFEDFGTTGLVGDPEEDGASCETKNNFCHFYRVEGKSSKGEKDIGRWGVGKQVFLLSSRIKSIFGLTVRNDDKKKLLMGMSVLKTHIVDDIRYTPDGWLGVQSSDDSDFILPIEDNEYINSFSQLFDLQRGNEPGLSIIVPWFDDKLSDDNLFKAVLEGYFCPILQGKLEVIIETDGFDSILDADKLDEQISRFDYLLDKDNLSLIDLAKWRKKIDVSEYVVLNNAKENGWLWDKNLIPESHIEKLKALYENGENIAIRVPVTIERKHKSCSVVMPLFGGKEENNNCCQSHFDVFLCKTTDGQNGVSAFIREGIIIPEVRRRFDMNSKKVKALVVAESGELATLLGDSENPAHTQWNETSEKLSRYKDGSKLVKYVKNSVSKLVGYISEIDKKEDKNLLIDVFYLDDENESEPVKAKIKKNMQKDESEPEINQCPDTHHKSFEISKINNGFVVYKNLDGEDCVNSMIQIQAAYHVRSGNPLKKYHGADFKLNELSSRLTGLDIVKVENNQMLLLVTDNNFRVEISGFDENRDLFVSVKQIEGSNDN